MMKRTHLAIGALVVLLFLPQIENDLIFIPIALIATILPDIDTGFSDVGKIAGSKIVRFFVKHRGILHSYTFCIIISVILAGFIPVLALPFFVGYALHLFVDSFTYEGIRPFWPSRITSSWRIKTGSVTEVGLFVVFVLADLVVLAVMIQSLF